MRAEPLRLTLGIAALAILIVGAAKILFPFATPILWALVLGSATWPAFERLNRWLGGRIQLSALLMTVALTIVVLMPFVALGLALAKEARPAVERIHSWATSEEDQLPEWTKQVPWIADGMHELKALVASPEGVRDLVLQGAGRAERLLSLGRNLLRNLIHLIITIFTLFFVYRDGEALVREARTLIDRIAVGRGLQLLHGIRETVRAVLYGWVMTAAAQGLVAMLGYWIAGLRAPVLLGMLTGLAAVVPFGVGLVWIPAILSLIADGEWGHALFLTIWSLLVVGLIDNVLRPAFISGPSRVPFILVFFGVLGGIATFGLLGVVLGPVLLAVLLALWRQAREALAVAARANPASSKNLDAPSPSP